MIKTYKHKTLGWSAKELTKVYKMITNDGFILIPKELIENSDDWIEEKQEDWIDKARDRFNSPITECSKHDWKDSKFFREAIEKHMPKISEEELYNCKGLTVGYSLGQVEILLKSKDLYLSNL